jgi:TonB-dependent SusC/RagA subfamily outer membrane receptor
MLRTQPGVLVSGRRVIIQGISTFYGNTEPLYVIDGMTVSNIDGIPPQQVKSIDVLKGPSASIYGSRGANGVIIITMKKAK